MQEPATDPFKPRTPANRRGHLLVLLAATSLSLPLGCSTIDQALQTSRLPCGPYRWAIKTLTDPDVILIKWQPEDSALRPLVELPPPPAEDSNRRLPSELQVYRIKAILVGVRLTLDHDIHLQLRDPLAPDIHMIAEIPDPLCAKGSGHEAEFAAARKQAELIHAKGGEPLVEVTGVGFFDSFHPGREHARNGFELHPVLALSELPPKRR